MINFFRLSSKRQDALNKAVDEVRNDVKKKRLQKYCATGWVENMEAILQFEDFFKPIFSALEDIEMTGNRESSKDAYSYQQALRNGEFIVAMVVINEVFAHAKPLTVYLQKTNIDLADAMEMADTLIKLLEDMRVNVMAKFHELFISAQNIAKEIQEKSAYQGLQKRNFIVQTINLLIQKSIIAYQYLFRSSIILLTN